MEEDVWEASTPCEAAGADEQHEAKGYQYDHPDLERPAEQSNDHENPTDPGRHILTSVRKCTKDNALPRNCNLTYSGNVTGSKHNNKYGIRMRRNKIEIAHFRL